MSRTSNTAQRREQIARAFLKVMAKHGYDGAAISEVAGRAKLAPGLIHYHFKNKQEILLAAMHLLLAEHAELVAAQLGSSTEPAAQLVAFIELHLGWGTHSNPDALACWVQLGAEALRQRRIKAALEAAITDLVERLAAVIQRGVRARVFACEDAKAAAAALVATIQGYFTIAATARGAVPPGSAAPCVLRMAEGLLRCKLARPARRST
jgi:TetR/AcrR family transcriptional regulator, transcriptional repressor of bet genes